ncbi:MAG: hypothetical protein H6757_00775 [Candidatus Omnitrophica bacterium]|nr:hypothetical protein [Candidatus Omnitrophota bacterium]
MNKHPDEKEIEDLLKSFRVKRPDSKDLENYETEVLRKIHSVQKPAGTGFAPGFYFSLSAALLLALFMALGLFFQANRPLRKQISQAKAEQNKALSELKAISPQILAKLAQRDLKISPAERVEETLTEVPQSRPETESSQSGEIFSNTLSRDILILELLGEETGIDEGFDEMTVDFAWVQQPITTAG